jgi:hypothetical protein
MTFIIGFWARAGAIMCGVICCCVALFGTVEHGLLPGASAHRRRSPARQRGGGEGWRVTRQSARR